MIPLDVLRKFMVYLVNLMKHKGWRVNFDEVDVEEIGEELKFFYKEKVLSDKLLESVMEEPVSQIPSMK